MIQALLVYTSMTGNTKQMAHAVAEGISANPCVQLTEIDLYDSHPKFLSSYDCIIIGCYTDGDGDIPYEMLDLYDELESDDLSNIVVGLFGSGDKSYELYCGALDTFSKQFNKIGVNQPLPIIKVDLEPSKQELSLCYQFGIKIINHISSNGFAQDVR